MQTKSIVQASVDVIRITRLRKGDTFKMFDDSSYGDKTRYGVVLDVLNDGDRTFIEVMTYKKNYGSMDAEYKVITDKDNASFFPVEPNEIAENFDSVIDSIKRSIIDKQNEILKLEQNLSKTEELVSNSLAQSLQVPEYKTMPQNEYDEKLAAING